MQLPFDTPTEFIALALVLIAGWFLGLASRSGGRKWRARAQEAERERDEARRRIATLETENAELTRRASADRPAVAPAADPTPDTGWRGWFGWGRDNLARIRGVGEPGEKLLNEHGIKTYRAIETLSAEEEAALEQRMGLAQGTIAREGWREQAAMLRNGDEDAHDQRFR
jgi:predicted flap endonuclease-1-like 5' DNA nuclease